MIEDAIREYNRIQNDIDTIMDCFNFEKCHEVMTFLNWKWHDTNGVPEVYELRRHARRMIRDAVENTVRTGESQWFSECGGFYVQVFNKTEDDPKIRISLRFTLSSWDNFQ